jgi:hypothetical protein
LVYRYIEISSLSDPNSEIVSAPLTQFILTYHSILMSHCQILEVVIQQNNNICGLSIALTPITYHNKSA